MATHNAVPCPSTVIESDSMSDHYEVIDVHKSAKALEVAGQLNALAGDGYQWVGTIPLGDSTLVLMSKADPSTDGEPEPAPTAEPTAPTQGP
jgi:hypothetical protein